MDLNGEEHRWGCDQYGGLYQLNEPTWETVGSTATYGSTDK